MSVSDAAAYKQAASRARLALYSDPQPGAEALLVVCREAKAAAVDGASVRHWTRIIDMLEAGRTFRVKSYPAMFTVDGTDPELAYAVEQIFAEGVEER